MDDDGDDNNAGDDHHGNDRSGNDKHVLFCFACSLVSFPQLRRSVSQVISMLSSRPATDL